MSLLVPGLCALLAVVWLLVMRLGRRGEPGCENGAGAEPRRCFGCNGCGVTDTVE